MVVVVMVVVVAVVTVGAPKHHVLVEAVGGVLHPPRRGTGLVRLGRLRLVVHRGVAGRAPHPRGSRQHLYGVSNLFSMEPSRNPFSVPTLCGIKRVHHSQGAARTARSSRVGAGHIALSSYPYLKRRILRIGAPRLEMVYFASN